MQRLSLERPNSLNPPPPMFHNSGGANAARLAEPAASSGGGLATTRDEIQCGIAAASQAKQYINNVKIALNKAELCSPLHE